VTAGAGTARGLDRFRLHEVVTIGAPFLLAALASSSSGLIDSSMMAYYGDRELAAVAGASPIFDLFSSLVLASVVGYQILSARFAGADDTEAVRATFRISTLYCGACAAVLGVACVLAGRQLTAIVVNGGADLARLGGDYLLSRSPTLLLMVPFCLLAATLNAHRLVRYAMVAGLLVSGANVLLDVLLIYGSGPLPRLGVVGNGVATTLSWLLGLLYLWVAAARNGFPVRPVLTVRRRMPAADFETSVVRLGWPAMVSAAIDYLSTLVFFALIGFAGAAALGGGRLAFETTILLFGLMSAFSAGGRILIGRSIGAGTAGAARECYRATRFVLLAGVLPVALLLIAVPGVVAGLLTSSSAVVRSATSVFPLVGLGAVLMAWTLSNVSLIRALGHTRWDMWANCAAAVVVQLPIAWYLTVPLGLGVTGAFVGFVGYWLARAVLTHLYAARALGVVEADSAVEAAIEDAAGEPVPRHRGQCRNG
jgi:MATE family multidrug resistance protein